MKKQLSIICSSLVLGVIAQSAVANNGTIDFVGGVSDSTCEVTVNGQTNNATVNLPIVSSKLLDAAGKTAGRTFLKFELKNCNLAAGTTKASIFYVAGNSINTAGRLDNSKTTDNTQNVDLQILDSNMAVMDLGLGAGAQSKGAVAATISAGVATIRNAVEYYATAKATAGGLTSSVQYEINYE